MSQAFRFGDFELRPAQRALLLRGDPLKLGGRAFDILIALVERRERLVEIDELLDVVWPGLAVEENNLSVQISSLRKLLGQDVIATVRGRGYRFTAPLVDTAAPAHTPGEGTGVGHWRGALLCVQRTPGSAPAVGSRHAADATAKTSADTILHGLETLVPGRVAGRIVHRSTDRLCIAFARAADSARVALRAQQQASHADAAPHGLQPPAGLQLGIVAADATPAGLIAGDMELAQQLAQSAGRNDIIVTADLVGEFVSGVDGEVEDLGDLPVGTHAVRAYRVRPAQDWAAAPSVHAAAKPGQGLPADAGVAELSLRLGIAVLPFEGLVSGDPDDMLGEALADDTISFLSRSPEFNVVSGLSSRRLKRCGLSAAYMADCLSASYLLAGSYRVAAGRVLLNVHLQDTRRGTVIRSMQLDASMHDAFAPVMPLGHRVGQEVAQALFSDAMQQSALRPLPELDSYALLLGAIGLMHRAAPREFERARAMLDHLAQRSGCRGVAAAWLAKWHVLRVVQGWSADASADSQLALEHVARSLDDNSRDALALSIGGLVHAYLRKDLGTAGHLYEAAIEANPSEPLAWLFKGTLQAYLGRGSDAEAASEQALRLSPIDPMKYFFDSLAATAALSNGSWERSATLSQRSLKANRSHASTWRTLAYALVKLDRMDEARAAVRRLVEIEPGFTVSRFKERFPGRDGPMAAPWAEALTAAGLPA